MVENPPGQAQPRERAPTFGTRGAALWGIGIVILMGCLGASEAFSSSSLLVWNASSSMPVGLYAVSSPGTLKRGDTVIARLPEDWRELAAARGYLPSGVPVIKRVAGIAGDRVCAQGITITINGRVAGRRLAMDSKGRRLQWWDGCRQLGEGSVFLLTTSPASFDGRYLGVTGPSDLLGRARPIWTR